MSDEARVLDLIGRTSTLFFDDVDSLSDEISTLVKSSCFLVIGGAGSIGQALTKEIFKRSPRVLHVVDINENNMVELVRDIRSSIGYMDGDFRTFAIDCGGREFETLMACESSYDYVFNLSALKHVRSEKDPYTLMRMLSVNIFNTIDTFRLSRDKGAKKVFLRIDGQSRKSSKYDGCQQADYGNVPNARERNHACFNGTFRKCRFL